MPIPKNYSDHIVTVDAETHTVTIKPRYVDPKNSTITFGLGDAVIKLNTKNLPEKIVVPITGESSGVGLLPPDPYGFRMLGSIAASFTNASRTVEGYNGSTATVTYPLAVSGFYAKEADIDTGVALTGVGTYEVGYGVRLEW